MNESDKVFSRRDAVGLVGMGLAAAASGSATAQISGQQGNNSHAPVAKDDPRSKYPKPPFQEQTQPWPGLAGKMNPKPDHGETSYRGSGRLGRPQGADHRRRLGHGPRRGDRLCARRRRRGDQLPACGRAGRARGHSAHQRGRPTRFANPWRSSRPSVLPAAGRGGRAEARGPRYRGLQCRAATSRRPRFSTSAMRISMRR